MSRTALLILIAFFAACSPYRALRRASFAYTTPEGARTVALKVPRGWRTAPSATEANGIQSRVFRYRDGSVFYVAYAPAGGDVQPIDRELHLPKLRLPSDTVYKQLNGDLYWREDKKGLLRAGYINVPEGKPEMLFDSAVNFVKRAP